LNTANSLLGIGDPDTLHTYRYAQEISQQSYIAGSSHHKDYLTVVLGKSAYTETYTRTYSTLGGVLAVVTGYLSTFCAVIGILASRLHQLNYKINLANTLKSSQQNDEVQIDGDSPTQSVKSAHEDVHADYTWLEVLKLRFFGFFRSTKNAERSNTWKYYENKVIENTDVRTIVNKLDAFERLKKVILTSEQLTLLPDQQMDTQELDKHHLCKRKKFSRNWTAKSTIKPVFNVISNQIHSVDLQEIETKKVFSESRDDNDEIICPYDSREHGISIILVPDEGKQEHGVLESEYNTSSFSLKKSLHSQDREGLEFKKWDTSE
jgi:hypothetical protein